MATKPITGYVVEAVGIEVVRKVRTPSSKMNIKDLAVFELASFVYDSYVKGNSAFFHADATAGDQGFETLAEKTLYVAIIKFIGGKALPGINEGTFMSNVIDFGVGSYLGAQINAAWDKTV